MAQSRTPLIVAVMILLGIGWYYHGLLLSEVTPKLYDAGIPVISLLPAQASAESSFSYPALGIRVPVSFDSHTDPFSIEDWMKIRDHLQHGVSLSFDTNDFSATPVAYVIGHSSDVREQPFAHVFAGLNQAEVGDVLTLSVDGTAYKFTVTDKKEVQPTDVKTFESLNRVSDTKQRLLLVTCWPVYTTRNRFVVVAERNR